MAGNAMTDADVCARCGHERGKHTTERALGVDETNRSVCLMCPYWYEDGRVGRKVFHRFTEVEVM